MNQLSPQIKTNATVEKPLFFMNCAIHAREWITVSTCMYIARQVGVAQHVFGGLGSD